MKDLHIHTSYSDGEYNEFEILNEVVKSGVSEFAICDHDTIEGSQKVFELLQKGGLNLKFHSGVELTCRLNNFLGGINMHILARDFDFNNKQILEIIQEISVLRKTKISLMVQFVESEYNIIIPKDILEETIKNTKSFGKPHLYSILCQIGNFDREQYYRKMDKLNTNSLKLDTAKTITKLKSYAKTYLAHPVEIMREHNLGLEEIEKIIKKLKELGISGVETYHSSQTKQLQNSLSQIAKKYCLEECCGSDFHGPNVKPNLHIGDTQTA